jgi:glyoxylase-like metal-dependent hydrolase (beta-lactamase superfamily II)
VFVPYTLEKSMKLVSAVVLAFAIAQVAIAQPAPPIEVPELEYLKAVNQAEPTSDPQLIFLLSAQFANANRLQEGISVFDGMLAQFGPRLTPAQKAMYLTALAPLRARNVVNVPPEQRAQWVKDTVAMLDDADKLTGGQAYFSRWMSAVVRAGLPAAMGQGEHARQDLIWCEQHTDAFPHLGWLREIYFQLGAQLRAKGDIAGAERYLRQSGYKSWNKPVTMTAPFSVDSRDGNKFWSRRIQEVVPGRVFVLSGFDFTEFYFIVSEDGKQLIAIDAAARSDTAKAAYEALKKRIPGLPSLTTVFVTHAHWDHVGGERYFRSVGHDVKFYGSANNHLEQSLERDAGRGYAARFFGQAFNVQDVWNYKPDVSVDRVTRVRVGGTEFELIPEAGGETQDALLIHMPREGIMFTGDVMMPYIGGPFLEEGNLDGMFVAIEDISKRNPRLLLHGHEPLTRVFNSPALLRTVRSDLTWLREQVIAAMRAGDERGSIQHANLMPPGILQQGAGVQLAYLVLRENVINRIYDQHAGYWQAHLEGMDSLTLAERGRMLIDYLGIDEQRLAQAAKRMMADGRLEQAAMLVQWARARGPIGPELDEVGRTAFAKLAEHYQEFNPFKFIIYTGEAHLDLAPVHTEDAASADAAH